MKYNNTVLDLADKLQCEINRMCCTDDVRELEKMRDWAIVRINHLYDVRKGEFINAQCYRKNM